MGRGRQVSVPYEITLLSNLVIIDEITIDVSVPYEITLLSNLFKRLKSSIIVSVPLPLPRFLTLSNPCSTVFPVCQRKAVKGKALSWAVVVSYPQHTENTAFSSRFPFGGFHG